MDKILDKLTTSKNPVDLFKSLDNDMRNQFIIYLFENAKNDHAPLVSKILQYMLTLEEEEIEASLINALCIILARTHDPVYIKDIVAAKSFGSMDFRMIIDSNLLFEFSPGKSRETCVKDTVKYVNSTNNKEEWFQKYKSHVNHYGKSYGEDVVINIWNNYKKKRFIDYLKADYPEYTNFADNFRKIYG